MQPLVELLVSVVAVLVASVLFVNAIEYIAGRFRWSHSFTGAIVTPLFTSVPELFIFLLAIFAYAGGKGHEIGLGTIFGEPFMVSTLSYFLVLLSVVVAILLGKSNSRAFTVEKEMQLPYVFIAILFPWLLIPGLIHSMVLQYLMGAVYLFLYVVYILLVRRTATEGIEEEGETPYFVRMFHKPQYTILQVAIAVILLYLGSTLLIESITQIAGSRIGTALSLSIILIPVATAIPETVAGMIWAFKGKNNLAIGSLVGENVLYATFYPGVALMLVPWTLHTGIIVSVVATTLVSAMYFFFVRRGRIPIWVLPIGFLFYIGFVISLYL